MVYYRRGGMCSFTPSVVLAQGEGSWKIKTRNEIGDGPWSSTLDFTIDDTWAPKVDFNNDGKTDILWRNNTTGGALAWFMDGTMILNPTNWIHQGVSLQWEIAAP
jgi:hypothetical protein